jgi:hypothetical protein
VGSLFYRTFSVTRIYGINDRVRSERWWWIDEDKHPCLNPLKPKLIYIIYKNSVCTSKRTTHFTIRKIKFLMMFKEIIVVYNENCTESINTICRIMTAKADGIYSYRSALKG